MQACAAELQFEDLYENTGLLAEYFAPATPAELCDSANGSTQAPAPFTVVHRGLYCLQATSRKEGNGMGPWQVLASRLPNIARRVLRNLGCALEAK